MTQMTGARALTETLIANGVDTVFGLPGVQLDNLFSAFFDAGERLSVIHTRHEQGAAYMAVGYAAASGRVGCYAVVPGPGFLNTTAALSTAYARNDKVLCLAGQIPSTLIGRGFGLLHEIPDQLGIMQSLSKWAARVDGAAEAPGAVAEAFRQMNTGRPRPAGLEIPMDVLGAKADMAIPAPLGTNQNPPVDSEGVAAAGKILGEARNPLMVVGSGAIRAGAEVKAMAELLQAPVIANRMGRGILDARHHLSVTNWPGHKLWAEADAVLAVGTRLQMQQMQWGLDKDLKVVRVDLDAKELKRFAPPAVGIQGDAAEVLAALLEQTATHNRKRASRKDEMERLDGQFAEAVDYLRPQLDYVGVIRDELPEDGILVDELTQMGYVGRQVFPVYSPRTYLVSGYQGTLGWGLATSLGVKLANPDKRVISVSGDGGFMFTIQELASAVQHEIAVVAIIFNDQAFGNVRRIQKQDYGNRLIASDLHNPDFQRLAESFGALGLRAKSPEELRQAIRQGFDHKGPVLIEVPVGELPDPWPIINLPRVRPKS